MLTLEYNVSVIAKTTPKNPSSNIPIDARAWQSRSYSPRRKTEFFEHRYIPRLESRRPQKYSATKPKSIV